MFAVHFSRDNYVLPDSQSCGATYIKFEIEKEIGQSWHFQRGFQILHSFASCRNYHASSANFRTKFRTFTPIKFRGGIAKTKINRR